MSSLLDRDPVIDTFKGSISPAKPERMPRLQNPVDSLSEYSAYKKYGVEMHARRRKRREYLIL